MPGKGSKARKKAVQRDVETRAQYAFSSGDHQNPYGPEDKRYGLFQAQLARTLFLDAEFRDMCDVLGGGDSLVPRQYPHPGPVLDISELPLYPVEYAD